MATIGVKIELEGAPQYKENMQNLTAQTKLYSAQMKRLQQEMSSGVSAYTKSITTSKALQQQLEAQTNQSKLLEEQIQKTTEKYGEDSTQVIRLKTQYENLQTQIAKTNQALSEQGGLAGAIAAEFKEVGSKISSVGESISSMGKNLTTKVSAPIAGLGAVAVKTAADFDSSMSQVAATMGYTAEQLNDGTSEASKTMSQLSQFAQDMGKSTAFSASEAAQALNYMALAGYDAQTSMKMLPTVLDLAAAGDIGLAEASDMVTDAQSALGLSLEETSTMVDQMAKASSKSNTSVAQLGEAILTVGATASNMAGGTTELATSLGVLADNGIKGAEGGTHLRNMILSLQDAAKDGAVDFGEFSVEVYDSEGNFRALSDIMQEVSSNMDGMSQESKDAITSGIFNKTDLASVNAMLQTSSERFDELKASIEGSEGAASDMAKVKLDNLNGQITLLKSALEGIAIQFGTIIMPYVQKFVEKIGEVVDWLANLDEGTQKIIVTIAAVVAAIGPVLAIVGSVTKSIGNITMGVGKVIQYGPAIIGVATKIGALITGSLVPAIGAVVTAIIPFLPIIAAVAAGIAAVVLVIKNWGAITDWISEKWTALTQFLSEAVANMITFFQEHFGILGQLFAVGIENISTIISTAVMVIQTIITSIGEVIKAIMQGDWDQVLQIIVNAWLKIHEAINKAKEKIKQTIVKFLTGVKDEFLKLKDAALQWGSDMIQNFIDGILAKWEALKETVANVANTVKDYLGFSEPDKGPMSHFNDWPKHMMEQYAHGIENMRYVVQAAVSDVASDVAVLENPIDATEIYDAVRLGASNANVSLSIGEREFSRSLRNMGVMFNG